MRNDMNPAIFIANVGYKSSAADLGKHLQAILPFELESLSLALNRQDYSSGTAFLRLRHPEDAYLFIGVMKDEVIEGRRVLVRREHDAAEQYGFLLTAIPEGGGT